MGHSRGRKEYLASFKCSKSEFLSRHAIGKSFLRRTSHNAEFCRDDVRQRNGQAKPSQEAHSPTKACGSANSPAHSSSVPTGDSPQYSCTPEERGDHTQKCEHNVEDGAHGPLTDIDNEPNDNPRRPLKMPSDPNTTDACQPLMEKLFQLTEGFMEAFLGNSGEEDPNGQTHSIYAAF